MISYEKDIRESSALLADLVRSPPVRDASAACIAEGSATARYNYCMCLLCGETNAPDPSIELVPTIWRGLVHVGELIEVDVDAEGVADGGGGWWP